MFFPPCRKTVQSYLFFAVIVLFSALLVGTQAQPEGAADNNILDRTEAEEEERGPQAVTVQPTAEDDEIEARLQRILEATQWFQEPKVRVDQGVVFLSGSTENEIRRKWAGDLARSTQDVVAVVNRIQVREPVTWDMTPALAQLRDISRTIFRSLPLLVFGLVVLVVAYFAAHLMSQLMRAFLSRRSGPAMTPILREILARASGIGVFLLGLYLVLLVVGLARLAVTVLGGTGLIGLVIGIAFRDITENFLASVFLSIQRPFRAGDLIEVDGVTGIVQRLTIRTTVLMALDGNHIQIPNSTIYKSTLRNFTSNPTRREDFTVGIGYDDVVAEAQEVARQVLQGHPAVLNDPEPWVLVDSLGASTVNLKIYFWLDGTEHSWLKVKSSVIRLVKRAFQENGISMPDEAREIIIPQEVAIRLRRPGDEEGEEKTPQSPPPVESDEIATAAEAGLGSETSVIESHGKNVRMPEEGRDLLSS